MNNSYSCTLVVAHTRDEMELTVDQQSLEQQYTMVNTAQTVL